MKLLLLADEPNPRLWDHLDRRLLEGVNLVLSCGDLPASYLSFLTCFTDAPILYVHGNHDGRHGSRGRMDEDRCGRKKDGGGRPCESGG